MTLLYDKSGFKLVLVDEDSEESSRGDWAALSTDIAEGKKVYKDIIDILTDYGYVLEKGTKFATSLNAHNMFINERKNFFVSLAFKKKTFHITFEGYDVAGVNY